MMQFCWLLVLLVYVACDADDDGWMADQAMVTDEGCEALAM